jgi:hypothetical protein
MSLLEQVTKKNMPDITVMKINNFKDDYRIFDVLPCKLALPTYRTVVPLPWLANIEYQRQ